MLVETIDANGRRGRTAVTRSLVAFSAAILLLQNILPHLSASVTSELRQVLSVCFGAASLIGALCLELMVAGYAVFRLFARRKPAGYYHRHERFWGAFFSKPIFVTAYAVAVTMFASLAVGMLLPRATVHSPEVVPLSQVAGDEVIRTIPARSGSGELFSATGRERPARSPLNAAGAKAERKQEKSDE